MNSQNSRKIIVASAMAVVVVIGVVTFALRSHPVASVAQVPDAPKSVTQTPAADLRAAEIPAAPPPAAQIPDAPAPVAQVPEAPAAVAHHDSVGTNSTDTATPPVVDRKLPRKQHLAKATDTSAVATDGTVARTELPPPPAINSLTDDQKAGTSTEFPASDSQTPPQ